MDKNESIEKQTKDFVKQVKEDIKHEVNHQKDPYRLGQIAVMALAVISFLVVFFGNDYLSFHQRMGDSLELLLLLTVISLAFSRKWFSPNSEQLALAKPHIEKIGKAFNDIPIPYPWIEKNAEIILLCITVFIHFNLPQFIPNIVFTPISVVYPVLRLLSSFLMLRFLGQGKYKILKIVFILRATGIIISAFEMIQITYPTFSSASFTAAAMYLGFAGFINAYDKAFSQEK